MHPSCIFVLELSSLKNCRSCLAEVPKRLPMQYGYCVHNIQSEIVVHPKFSKCMPMRHEE